MLPRRLPAPERQRLRHKSGYRLSPDLHKTPIRLPVTDCRCAISIRFHQRRRLPRRLFYPVTTDALPTNADVDADWNEALSQDGGAQAFLDQQIADLNALSPSDWRPISTLDAVVQSLQISGMPSNAVIGQSAAIADTGTDAAIVSNDQYTISYRENGIQLHNRLQQRQRWRHRQWF